MLYILVYSLQCKEILSLLSHIHFKYIIDDAELIWASRQNPIVTTTPTILTSSIVYIMNEHTFRVCKYKHNAHAYNTFVCICLDLNVNRCC